MTHSNEVNELQDFLAATTGPQSRSNASEIVAGLAALRARIVATEADPEARAAFDAKTEEVLFELDDEDARKEQQRHSVEREYKGFGVTRSPRLGDPGEGPGGILFSDLVDPFAHEPPAWSNHVSTPSPRRDSTDPSRDSTENLAELRLPGFPPPPRGRGSRSSRFGVPLLRFLISFWLGAVAAFLVLDLDLVQSGVDAAITTLVGVSVLTLGYISRNLSRWSERRQLLVMAGNSAKRGDHEMAREQLRYLFPPDPAVDHAAVYGRTLATVNALCVPDAQLDMDIGETHISVKGGAQRSRPARQRPQPPATATSVPPNRQTAERHSP